MELRAEMAANVWKVLACEGQQVSDGDTLVILESIVGDLPMVAEGDGVVNILAVAEGDAVQKGDLLVVLLQWARS